jgi:hypothetical protein
VKRGQKADGLGVGVVEEPMEQGEGAGAGLAELLG